MKRSHLNLYIDDDLLEWVKAEASRRRCSVSQVVREMLLRGMKMGVKEIDAERATPCD